MNSGFRSSNNLLTIKDKDKCVSTVLLQQKIFKKFSFLYFAGHQGSAWMLNRNVCFYNFMRSWIKVVTVRYIPISIEHTLKEGNDESSYPLAVLLSISCYCLKLTSDCFITFSFYKVLVVIKRVEIAKFTQEVKFL